MEYEYEYWLYNDDMPPFIQEMEILLEVGQTFYCMKSSYKVKHWRIIEAEEHGEEIEKNIYDYCQEIKKIIIDCEKIGDLTMKQIFRENSLKTIGI